MQLNTGIEKNMENVCSRFENRICNLLYPDPISKSIDLSKCVMMFVRVCLSKTGKSILDYTDGYFEILSKLSDEKGIENPSALLWLFKGAYEPYIKKVLFFQNENTDKLQAMLKTLVGEVFRLYGTKDEIVKKGVIWPVEANNHKNFAWKVKGTEDIPYVDSNEFDFLPFGVYFHKAYFIRNIFTHLNPEVSDEDAKEKCITLLKACICVTYGFMSDLEKCDTIWTTKQIDVRYSKYFLKDIFGLGVKT